jgi:hypothetical protein
MVALFRDTLTGSGLLRGTPPDRQGFRPDGLGWVAPAYPGQPSRGQTRTADGLANVGGAEGVIYGQYGFYVEYDNQGNGTRFDDVSPAISGQWLPGTTEWEVSFDFCPTYANTGGSFYGAMIDLGNFGAGPVQCEIKASSGKWFFDAMHPVGGLGRAQMPEAVVPGVYRITLKHERNRLTMTGGGGSFELGYGAIGDERNFDHVRLFPQPGIVLRDIVLGSAEPIEPPRPFWTGFVRTFAA